MQGPVEEHDLALPDEGFDLHGSVLIPGGRLVDAVVEDEHPEFVGLGVVEPGNALPGQFYAGRDSEKEQGERA